MNYKKTVSRQLQLVHFISNVMEFKFSALKGSLRTVQRTNHKITQNIAMIKL